MLETLIGSSSFLKDYIKFSLQDSINFLKLLDTFQTQINYIHVRLQELIKIFDIKNVSGHGLDFIGIVIGQERVTSEYVNNNFVFDTKGKGFDTGVFDVGGDLIDDEKYRFLLKAKIIKNNTKHWARPDIIAYHQALLGEEEKFKIREDTLKVQLIFEKSLNNFKRQALNHYGMKISGVKIIYEVPLDGE